MNDYQRAKDESGNPSLKRDAVIWLDSGLTRGAGAWMKLQLKDPRGKRRIWKS